MLYLQTKSSVQQSIGCSCLLVYVAFPDTCYLQERERQRGLHSLPLPLHPLGLRRAYCYNGPICCPRVIGHSSCVLFILDPMGTAFSKRDKELSLGKEFF